MNRLEALDSDEYVQRETVADQELLPEFLDDEAQACAFSYQPNEEADVKNVFDSLAQERNGTDEGDFSVGEEPSQQLLSGEKDQYEPLSETDALFRDDQDKESLDQWDKTILERLQSNLRSLGFSEDEIKQYIDQLQQSDSGRIGKQSFGSSYGGMVCWGGSINCSSCYGPLIANSGLCRNG